MKKDIILVNEHDEILWYGEKMDIHIKWLLHRAISVLIFNNDWKILLQQRALNKYHCPWLWTNTTCTHPYPNEERINCAHRRLQEEMWFDCKLWKVFKFSYRSEFDNWLIENEIDHVFVGIYNGDVSINLDEANDYKRISIEDLQKDILIYSDKYTPWFKKIMENYVNDWLSID